jgi:hypothetical protein
MSVLSFIRSSRPADQDFVPANRDSMLSDGAGQAVEAAW